MTDDVTFEFRSAWCRLTMGSGPQRQTFHATGLNDAFGDLAQAVANLARPRPVVELQSVLWGDEPGGVFLDFASPVADHLALVVHAVAIRTWITAPDWTPERGEVLLRQVAPRHELASAFLRGFETVSAATKPGGIIPGWPHPFPDTAVTELRRALG
ncbi:MULTISPECIES: hypothetical protein [Amycolatopsis]|uniref:Uncharacterized protein n=1 Tax=Amycolatopsis albidoflavus TaxID=102226 RepID=A0ABW5I494_9PSEU